MKLNIIKRRKVFFIFSSALIVISLLSWIAWGLKPGIDFTGGSLLEVQFNERPTTEQINESLRDFDLGDIGIQQSGSDRLIIRFKSIDEETHFEIITKLKDDFGGGERDVEEIEIEEAQDEEIEKLRNKEIEPASAEATDEAQEEGEEEEIGGEGENIVVSDEYGNVIEGVSVSSVDSSSDVIQVEDVAIGESDEGVVELRFDSIGASIGQELRTKSYKAMLYVVIAIIFYVAWAFRKVSKPVTSWKYGVIAVIALLHDILITIGVFVFLGHFLGVEINTPFIAALLTILGYSVNDSIVVFDRVRENLHRYHENFDETVNDSINETITRSLNTSLTTICVLLAVYFFGGETIKNFVLALMVGMVSGTYSSIFIASPLLVTWHKVSEKLR
jgi:preprotein translocase subunit SecF